MFFRRKKPPSLDVIPGLVSLHDAFEGIAIIGGPGSGKTTGPGAEVIYNLLRLGCGILWLCAKPDEYSERVLKLCKAAGREDVQRFAPGGDIACDLMTTELRSTGASVESAASLLSMLMEVSNKQKGGHGEERFWAEFNEKAFRRAISAVWFPRGSCSLVDLYRCFASAPPTFAHANEKDQHKEWREQSFLMQALEEGKQKCLDNHDFRLAYEFWTKEWSQLAEKTRTICQAMATNVLDKFMSGPMAKLVASGQAENALDPVRHVLDGGVLAVDMPVLQYREQGIFTAIILKTMVQRGALKRDPNSNPPPVAVIADEAQWFLVSQQDMMTQTVARQSKLINVVMFQNLPMLYSVMGGHGAKNEIDGWLSCFMTKIVLANTCVETGKYFSDMFGSSYHQEWSGDTGGSAFQYSFSDDLFGRPMQGGPKMGWREHWRPDVPPETFGMLHKPNRGEPWTEGFVFQGGKTYPETGKPYKRMAFQQRF